MGELSCDGRGSIVCGCSPVGLSVYWKITRYGCAEMCTHFGGGGLWFEPCLIVLALAFCAVLAYLDINFRLRGTLWPSKNPYCRSIWSITCENGKGGLEGLETVETGSPDLFLLDNLTDRPHISFSVCMA